MCLPLNCLSACTCKRHAWFLPFLFGLMIPYGSAFALTMPSQEPLLSSAAPPGVSRNGRGAPGAPALQPWSIKPSLHFGGIYVNSTRNASPSSASASASARDYYVTEVNPELSINGRSPRASLELKYRMQNIFYAKHTSADATYHQLNAMGKMTAIRDFMYVDASSRMSQQIISPTESIYLGNFSVSNNRTDVRTYSLSPYIHYRLGTSASTIIRYRRRALAYSKRPQYDNNSNMYSVSLRSGPSYKKITWGINYSNDRILYAAYSSVYFETALGQLGWQVARSLDLKGSIGYDKNNYISAFGKTQGKRWNLGFTWSPDIKTSLSASYGRRYFGNIYTLEFRRRSHFTSWRARYFVEPRTVNSLQNSSFLVGLINPSGQVSLVNFLVPTITHQVYIVKAGRLSMNRRFNGGNLNITIYDTRREYQQSKQHTDYYGTYDSLTRKIGRRTDVTLNGAWVRYSYQVGSGYNYWYAGLQFSHQLSRRVRGVVRYFYSVHSNSAATGGYSENMVSAFVDVRL